MRYQALVDSLMYATKTCDKIHLAQMLNTMSGEAIRDWNRLINYTLMNVTKKLHRKYGEKWTVFVTFSELRLYENIEDACPYFVTDFDAILEIVVTVAEKQDVLKEHMITTPVEDHIWGCITAVFDFDM